MRATGGNASVNERAHIGSARSFTLAFLPANAGADGKLPDLLTLVDAKRSEIDIKYTALNDMSVMVVNGVIGDPAFGPDSPLYGAMGFVRKSERKSGLTKKTKKS